MQRSSSEEPKAVLGQPLKLRCGALLPNRLAKSAMTEGLADHRGRPTEQHERLYRTWSEGGAGLLISGNVIVDRRHLERPGNVILDGAIDTLTRQRLEDWVTSARVGGNALWIQISHAGRQTPRLVNPHPKAPSAVPVALPGKLFGVPVALCDSEIEELIERYVSAAVIASEAGFDGVQIHAAHGYLISEFLSPLANRRDDRWGGSLENRARFLMEIVRRTRSRLPQTCAVSVKLNSADFQKGGFASDESHQVAAWLEAARIDLLEISGGSYEQPRMMNISGLDKAEDQKDSDKPTPVAASTAAREAYFLEFAAELQRECRVPLMVTGGFRTAEAMGRAVADDGIAVIGLARPLCVDPAGAGKLLEGQRALDRFEQRLRVGPGWFGPRSPFPLLKAINGFGVISWYYQQLRRMGAGKQPDPRMGVFSAFVREQWTQSAHQRAARRLESAQT